MWLWVDKNTSMQWPFQTTWSAKTCYYCIYVCVCVYCSNIYKYRNRACTTLNLIFFIHSILISFSLYHFTKALWLPHKLFKGWGRHIIPNHWWVHENILTSLAYVELSNSWHVCSRHAGLVPPACWKVMLERASTSSVSFPSITTIFFPLFFSLLSTPVD